MFTRLPGRGLGLSSRFQAPTLLLINTSCAQVFAGKGQGRADTGYPLPRRHLRRRQLPGT